jgi:hypothetical protein
MRTLLRRYQKDIESYAKAYFGFAGAGVEGNAVKYAKAILQKDELSPVSSGIVIAGFGNNEIFPGLAHFGSDGYISRKPKIIRESFNNINVDTPSIIAPFAQHDMVQRFMEGIDPEYRSYLATRFGSLLVASCLFVLDK